MLSVSTTAQLKINTEFFSLYCNKNDSHYSSVRIVCLLSRVWIRTGRAVSSRARYEYSTGPYVYTVWGGSSGSFCIATLGVRRVYVWGASLREGQPVVRLRAVTRCSTVYFPELKTGIVLVAFPIYLTCPYCFIYLYNDQLCMIAEMFEKRWVIP